MVLSAPIHGIFMMLGMCGKWNKGCSISTAKVEHPTTRGCLMNRIIIKVLLAKPLNVLVLDTLAFVTPFGRQSIFVIITSH